MTRRCARATRGRVNHSLCMGMVMMGLVGVETEVVLGKHVGQSQGGWSHIKRCRSRLQGEEADDTQSHHLPAAQLCVCSSSSFMQLVDCALWCSTDAVAGSTGDNYCLQYY